MGERYIFSVSKRNTDGTTGEYLGDLDSDSPIFPKILMVESLDDGEEVMYEMSIRNVVT